ncbi:unnamed protein product [Cochlearia groenlandica]
MMAQYKREGKSVFSRRRQRPAKKHYYRVLRGLLQNPERKLISISSRNHVTENHHHHHHHQQFVAEVKVEKEDEMSMSLSQWLQPSKVPSSYLALLNEEPSSSTPDEKPPPDYVVKRVLLPNRNDEKSGPGRGIRTIYCEENILGSSSSTVKPSVCVQRHTYNDLFGSRSKVPVGRRSLRRSVYPLSKHCSEKLRSWKEKSNRKRNIRDFSELYVPSKQSIKYKRSYTTECERKQRILDNIKALGELLPHEFEDTPESILSDVTAHVKLLQLQMKELARSRLGGEPVTHPLISIEGYGHFINQEETTNMTKPMEEIMAEMLTNDPEGAASLLESKGLYLMPFSSVQGFVF